MPRPKLLHKKGKLVKEWSTAATASKAFALPKAGKPVKIKSVPLATPKSELRILPKQFAARELMSPDWWWPNFFCEPSLRVRKNQKDLTPIEWQRFIHASEALAESGMSSPTYAESVQIHMDAMDMHGGHAWGAHTMSGMNGRNFLAWHREYMTKLEARLIAINPLVSIPYWDWITDRAAIPAPLTDASDLRDWGITRGSSFNGSSLASAAQLNALLGEPNFDTFQSTLESSPFHNLLHNLVGGTMRTSGSPQTPSFGCTTGLAKIKEME